MTCGGCATAVEKVLSKKAGITDVKIDLEAKKVHVTSALSSDEVLETIKKTGKSCQFIGVQK